MTVLLDGVTSAPPAPVVKFVSPAPTRTLSQEPETRDFFAGLLRSVLHDVLSQMELPT